MNIQVRGDHLDITPALHDYAEKKISRIERHFDVQPEQEVHVTMGVERGMHRVEVTLVVHGVVFRAEETSPDMYASIDLVVDKLEQQFHRHKDRLNKRFRDRGLRSLFRERAESGVSVLAGLEEDGDLTADLVRVKRFPLKPMDVQEAIMQMDLLGHDFFVFTNASTDHVNVLYRRKSGNYGLIEPQS